MNDIVYIVTEESTWKRRPIFSTKGEVVSGIFEKHEEAVDKINSLLNAPLYKPFQSECKWTDANTAEIHDGGVDIFFRIHEYGWQ